MNKVRKLAVVIVALGSVSVARGDPIFDDLYAANGLDYGDSVGSWYNSQAPRTLSFDSTTNLLQYKSSWAGSDQNCFWQSNFSCIDLGSGQSGPGVLDWVAQLSSDGTELISGGASLFLDFGAGLELAAVGNVTSLGARGITVFSQEDYRVYIPQVTIELSYVDVRGESFLGNYWLWEGFTDFHQPTLAYTQSFDRDQYSRFSGDHMYAYRVPEPGTLALFGIGLAGMGLARRRKQPSQTT